MNSINHESYYLNHLEQQISLLIDSSTAYDMGKFYHAKSLSNIIRTIVKDVANPTAKTKTKSLLFHTGRKSKMKFYNTGFKARDPIISINLVGIVSIPSNAPTAKPTLEHIYLPLLNNSRFIDVRWLDFDDWWESDIIVSKSENNDIRFSRKYVVLTMAEQDGGTHVDSVDGVEINYFELATATKSLFVNLNNGIESSIVNLHYALVRQIAHELIISLKKEFNFGIEYNPTNQKNLRGIPEIQIKQFGVLAEENNGFSSRTKTPYKDMISKTFKAPENAAYMKIFF